MELTYECPGCGTVNRAPAAQFLPGTEADRESERVPVVVCQECGQERRLGYDFATAELTACPWCATEDLYIQKDFPHLLGLVIVAVGFVLSTIFWFFYMPIAAFTVLLATAALDGVLFFVVPDVTICYRCLGQYRGPGSNPGGRFASFDLAIGERYRQERLRVQELRRRHPAPTPSDPAPHT